MIYQVIYQWMQSNMHGQLQKVRDYGFLSPLITSKWDNLVCLSLYIFLSFWGNEKRKKTKYSPPKKMLMAQKPNLQIAKPIGGHVSYVPCWSLDPFVSWYFYRWNYKTIFWVDLQLHLHEFKTIFLDISWPSIDTNWSLGHFSIWTFVWSLESWLPFFTRILLIFIVNNQE